jgi:hypothetical protein
MRRKPLFLVAASIALIASSFAAFRVGQHMARRAAEQDRKREQIKELDDQLKKLIHASVGLSIERPNGTTQPDAGQRQAIGQERERIRKERDKLKKELSESAVPPLFWGAFR